MDLKKTFLIIDDDADDIDIFSDTVRRIYPKAIVISEQNGETALEKLKNGKIDIPDYIFLDLNMPGMNGIECLKALKGHPRLREIPVIIYTTSSDPFSVRKTRELGAVYFLTKPYSFQKLEANLRRAIQLVDNLQEK